MNWKVSLKKLEIHHCCTIDAMPSAVVVSSECYCCTSIPSGRPLTPS